MSKICVPVLALVLVEDEVEKEGETLNPVDNALPLPFSLYLDAGPLIMVSAELGTRLTANGMTMERRKVVYSGRVQGVGFRYTTVSVARRYPVTGYVQNLRDGRVVVLAEGAGVDLDRFLTDLEATMHSYIRESHQEKGAATGEFQGFQVSFDS